MELGTGELALGLGGLFWGLPTRIIEVDLPYMFSYLMVSLTLGPLQCSCGAW